jgi:hypothetical protein
MTGVTPIADVPDAPTIGTATDVGTARPYNNGAATVTYTSAATGGTVTTFTTTSTPGSFTATGASPVTVTGLQSATSYTFAVAAANANGTKTSGSTSAITATTVPDAPTIGTPTVATGQSYTGNANVSVPFTAPATGGKAISTYTVTSSSGGTATGSSSPISISDAVGTARTYTVTATNANGTGNASPASASTTPSSVPQAPTIGTFTDGGTGTSGTLSFTLNATGGSSITTVKYSTDGTNYTSAGSTSSPITISGLSVGSYTFYVKATNANGDSAASSSVAGTVIQPSNFFLISTVAGSGTSVTFSSIPSGYKSLQVRYIAKDSSTAANIGNIGLQINGDTGANYAWHYLFGFNGAAASSGNTSQARIWLGYNSIAMSLNGNGAYGAGIVDIIDYTNTSKNKTVKALAGVDTNVGAVYSDINASSGLWLNTAAVTSLTLFTPNSGFVSGTTFSLYGVS